MPKYKPIVDRVLTDELRDKMRPIDAMMLESMRRGRQAAFDQAEHVQRVGELHNRAIFLNSLGFVPQKLQEEVQAVLMPSGTPIVEESDGEADSG